MKRKSESFHRGQLLMLPGVILLILSAPTSSGQSSSADSTVQLQQQFQSVQSDTLGKIFVLPNDPQPLENGTLAGQLQTVVDSDLAGLSSRNEQQRQILTGKLNQISNNQGLSISDRKELSEALRKQALPLNALKDRIESFKAVLIELKNTGLSRWKDTYEQFRSISGEEKGREKLRTLVMKFCEPYGVIAPSPSSASQAGSPASAPTVDNSTVQKSVIQDGGIKTSLPMTGLPASSPNGFQIGESPAPDAIPYLKQEYPINVGVVRSMTPGDGSIAFTLGNSTTSKQPVRFRVVILNSKGVQLADVTAGWVFKKLDPGAEALIQCSFSPKEPEELKFTSLHEGFDSTPAWILLRSTDGTHSLRGGELKGMKVSKRNKRDLPYPLPPDLIPLSEELQIHKGVLERISFLQGKMNVSLRNDSPDKKPVAIRIYLLNANGIVVDRHDVHWWFKQMDPGMKTIEAVQLTPVLPPTLMHTGAIPKMDSTPRFLLIRSTDDSSYGG
jgi:hypothetical protein